MRWIIPVTFCLALTLTPIVKKLAIHLGAIDMPNERKVHSKIMPRLGGLAIYISFMLGFFYFINDRSGFWPIIVGGTLVSLIGIADDFCRLSAKVKFIGQLLASLIPAVSGLRIEYITFPDGKIISFGFLAIPITVFWIVSITNAINFIDGLDGLAAGVSTIAMITITTLAYPLGEMNAVLLGLLLIGSTLGFLVYNFYPAKIFMGDTGSLFIGYMISTLAIMGLTKSATVISLIIPIIILAVPIMDTFFAIMRRIYNGKPITAPDKYHLHHCLIRLGFSHRQAVMMIYLLSGIFSLAAIIFTKATIWGATFIIVLLLLIIELIVEATGLISLQYRPLLNLFAGKERLRNNGK